MPTKQHSIHLGSPRRGHHSGSLWWLVLLLSIMIRHAAVAMTFTELPSAYSLETYTSSGSGNGATWTVATHKQDHSTSAFYPASFVIKKTVCQNGNSQGFTVTWKDEFAI